MQEFSQKSSDKDKGDEIILGDYVRLLLSKLHWIILCAILAFSMAYLKLRYQDKIYEASGTVKIETDNNNLLREVAILKEFGSPKDKILTETYIIKSKYLVLMAASRLPINVSYYSQGRVVNKELYKRSPFSIVPVQPDSVQFDKSYTLLVEQPGSYEISWTSETGSEQKFKGRFDDTVSFDGNVAVIHIDREKYEYAKEFTNKFNFVFNSKSRLYDRISDGLYVDQIDKGASLITISYRDVAPDFASDFINALSKVYVELDVQFKSQTATQTIEFMDRLLKEMNASVEASELSMEEFKIKSNVLDLGVSNEKGLDDLTDLQLNKRLQQLQLVSIENIEKQIYENRNSTILPISLDGKVDPVLTDLLTSLNRLNFEKISKSEKLTDHSAAMIEINKQIDELVKSVKQNIRFSKQKINAQIEFLDKQINGIMSGIKQLPTTEKKYITLKRDLEVNQKVYGFLMQTKLEAAISRASIVSSARVIDEAEPPVYPVEPKSRFTIMIYVLLGILFCVTAIIATHVLNDKIVTVSDIEHAGDIPLLGSILAYHEKLDDNSSRLLAVKEHRTVFGESLRTVRTNLQFLLPDLKKKVITISSTISGEGKTFVSINLAGSLTMMDKKIVLIGCDMRKPQLENTFKTKNKQGLSSYLIGKATVQDILNPTELENLSIILAGPIPPNPAELINSEKMQQLLEELKKDFDYIILDTSPVGLVSDAIFLMTISDLVLYVVKSGYSKKNFIDLPLRIRNEHGLKNMYMLLNSYRINYLTSSGGYYGYGYAQKGSYGYYAEVYRKKTIFHTIVRWIKGEK